MMQAVEVYACIPHGFSMKRNHAGRHCLMPVLWKSSVSDKALTRRSANEVQTETRQVLYSTSKIFDFVKCRNSIAARFSEKYVKSLAAD